MNVYEVTAEITIRVEVDEDSTTIIRRCIENHDDEGVPQPDERGGRGWRNLFYPCKTRNDVIEHLAFAMGVRGYSLPQMDGFADLADDAARADVADVQFIAVEPINPEPVRS